MMELTQNQLIRLLSEMIQFGTIIEVQAQPLRYKVRFDEERTSDWLRSDVGHAAQVRDWHPLQEGEQVIVLKPFDTQGGVIVASLNQTQFDQPKDNLQLYYREFPDGTWLQYDMENSVLSASFAGDAEIDVIGNVRIGIEGDSSVDIGGNAVVAVKGNAEVAVDGTTKAYSKGNMTIESDADMALKAGGNMSLTATRIDLN